MQTILCNYCKKEIEISQALAAQLTEEERTHREEEILKAVEEGRKRTELKLREELELKEKNYENQLHEDKERIQQLMENILKANEETRALRKKDEEREIETQRKLHTLEENLKDEIRKKVTEEKQFEILQMKKQMEDMQKALEEAKRKSQQVSQQLQGEVMEIELESMLANAFQDDQIEPVAKGVNGADIKHIVKSRHGSYCGTILWEFKRTKHWDDKWIMKLKDDLREEKAHVAAIVSIELPKEITTGIGHKDGVWVCNFASVLPLALLLRKNLYDVAYQKHLQTNSSEKAELVYQYLTSHEFQQQIESMVETYRMMQDQLLREKVNYQKMWKVREEQMTKVLMNTANIVGSIQGKVGASMPTIKGLEILELEDGNQN